MKDTAHKVLQKILAELTRLSDGILLRKKLHKIYRGKLSEVSDWVLLSREGKIKAIEEMKKNSDTRNWIVYQSCHNKYSSEFYVDRIDALIALADKEKLKLKIIEEGISVMIICIGLAEEVKCLDHSTRKIILPTLKEKLLKAEKFGISFCKCFEEVLDISEKSIAGNRARGMTID